MLLVSLYVHLQQPGCVTTSFLESSRQVIALLLASIQVNHHPFIFPPPPNPPIDPQNFQIPRRSISKSISDPLRNLVKDGAFVHHPFHPVDIRLGLPKDVASQRCS